MVDNEEITWEGIEDIEEKPKNIKKKSSDIKIDRSAFEEIIKEIEENIQKGLSTLYLNNVPDGKSKFNDVLKLVNKLKEITN